MRLIDTIRKGSERAVDTSTVLYQTWGSLGGVDRPMSSFIDWTINGYAGNPVVFAVIQARIDLFSEATFKFRDLATKRLYGTPALMKLEQPWAGGTTAELLARMEQDVSIAGNAYVRDHGTHLERLRPDWVDIIHTESEMGGREVVGYVYHRGGFASEDSEMLDVSEVAHWSPIPDPIASFRGMSWLTPVLREINADDAMTAHKQNFMDNAATPNMVIRYDRKIEAEAMERLRERLRARFSGPVGDKTMVLDQGADMTIVGSTFEQMAFTAVQSAGEARIAAAGSVPPIVAGLQAGLDAATYSNYAAAIKAFGDLFMRAHWRGACGALAKLVEVPSGAQLWYDVSDIAALQDSETQKAEAASKNAATINAYVMNGFTPDSAIRAVVSGDPTLLEHTGAVSVQLYPQGKVPTND